MSDCFDYWCEHYGKGGGQCDRCTKKLREQDISDNIDLQVLLNRRAFGNIGAKGSNKDKGQGIQ
jgi:hypothetical protein